MSTLLLKWPLIRDGIRGESQGPWHSRLLAEPEPPAYLILREGGVAGEHWRRWTVQIEPERLVQGGRGQGGGEAWGKHIPGILNVLVRYWCQCRWVNCKSQRGRGGQLSACSRGRLHGSYPGMQTLGVTSFKGQEGPSKSRSFLAPGNHH